MQQLSLHRSAQRCTVGQRTALPPSAAQSPRAASQQLRSIPAASKQRIVTCAAVSVETEANALPVEKSGSNLKAVMDIEAIKAILPHRLVAFCHKDRLVERGVVHKLATAAGGGGGVLARGWCTRSTHSTAVCQEQHRVGNDSGKPSCPFPPP